MSDIVSELGGLESAARESDMKLVSDCANEAAAEIERLRREVKHREMDLANTRSGNDRLRKCIEELEQRIIVTVGNMDVDLLNALTKHHRTIDAQAERLKEQRERIEELDYQLGAIQEAADKHGWNIDDHHITDKEVNEAWRYMTDHSDQYIKGKMEQVLWRLGFVRCRKCGGGGRLFGPGYDREDPSTYKTCPDCNGREWVKK